MHKLSIVLLFLGACGKVEPIQINNHSSRPDSFYFAVVEASLEELKTPDNLLLDWLLEVSPEPDSACGVQGCTDTLSKRIFLSGWDGFPDSFIAYNLCHEIVHIKLHDGSHNQWSEFAKCNSVETLFGKDDSQ